MKGSLVAAALCLLAATVTLPPEPVVIAGQTFKLEVAADPPARARGLMGRPEIAEHGGMLFVFPQEGYRSFWMKDCIIDIDIAFLDRRGRIVSVHHMKAEPPKRAVETETQYHARLPGYPSRRPAQFAIELRSGSLDRLKLEPGQVIALDLPKLRKLAR